MGLILPQCSYSTVLSRHVTWSQGSQQAFQKSTRQTQQGLSGGNYQLTSCHNHLEPGGEARQNTQPRVTWVHLGNALQSGETDRQIPGGGDGRTFSARTDGGRSAGLEAIVVRHETRTQQV